MYIITEYQMQQLSNFKEIDRSLIDEIKRQVIVEEKENSCRGGICSDCEIGKYLIENYGSADQCDDNVIRIFNETKL